MDRKDIYEDKERIDPSLSPTGSRNRVVAERSGWTYDPEDRVYRDREGEMIADEFGQRF